MIRFAQFWNYECCSTCKYKDHLSFEFSLNRNKRVCFRGEKETLPPSSSYVFKIINPELSLIYPFPSTQEEEEFNRLLCVNSSVWTNALDFFLFFWRAPYDDVVCIKTINLMGHAACKKLRLSSKVIMNHPVNFWEDEEKKIKHTKREKRESSLPQRGYSFPFKNYLYIFIDKKFFKRKKKRK